ncbi:2-dehydropantoate 2-reductase [Fictibacillus nanhaiensis]|uniref:ketopantoate reductase family protein n=1 Tax=Fictibacillus nanhaiensis TaxID=742169 RepID=UPI001C94F577|nr:2-dehydropantoate 2-reductase [Fictibacillus nanhaiensis]MBY6036198.1 2-dehydropantoate 2-reductase [Fictibacillus nanhaiensis]
MKVCVIGGGAIGLLVSYFLKMNGVEPVIYTRTEEQAQKLNASGITYRDKNRKKHSVPVQSKPIQAFSGSEERCVIAVKQTAIEELSFLKDQQYASLSCLFLQNGISHLTFLNTVVQKDICVGVVEHGAGRDGYSMVNHLGSGRIKISSYRGNRCGDWQSIFNNPTFPIVVEQDYERMLFEKLVMNASINPVTAMLRITNGELLENKYALSLMNRLFDETIIVLQMEFKRDELWKELLSLCRTTSLNRSSMFKSVEIGEQTEIDSITGEILKLGKKRDLHLPFSEFVYLAVKALDWRG